MSATSATAYEYAFTKTEAGSISFNIKSGATVYAPESNTVLALGTGQHIGRSTSSSTNVWSFSYDKDIPYKIVVSYDEADNSISVYVRLRYEFLVADDILSGSQFNDDKLTWTFTSEYALAEVEFTYDTTKTGWDSATPFAVHNAGWGDKWCGATVRLGEDFVELMHNASGNANFEGLTDGTTYVLSIKATTDTIYAKVLEK